MCGSAVSRCFPADCPGEWACHCALGVAEEAWLVWLPGDAYRFRNSVKCSLVQMVGKVPGDAADVGGLVVEVVGSDAGGLAGVEQGRQYLDREIPARYWTGSWCQTVEIHQLMNYTERRKIL